MDERWPLLLFPELLPREVSNYFGPLSRVAHEVGDERAYLVDEQEPEIRFTTAWKPDEFARERFRIPLGALMFSDSSRWGAVLTDEGFPCLGGETEVMRRVADALGGKGQVRTAFEE